VIPFALLCVVSCGGLVAAERVNHRAGIWVCKTTAASAYVAAAIAGGALDTQYGSLIVAALCLCWLGDVLLIPEQRPRVFLFGIGGFFLGHLVYAGAFGSLGVSLGALALFAALSTAAGVPILRWLKPHLTGLFRSAVPAYIIAIAAMVSLAGSAAIETGSATIAIGALLFAISDLSVARNRFIEDNFVNSAWGLPCYFIAQLILASSAIG
jgi:uncharacterized membrane protein YhhN